MNLKASMRANAIIITLFAVFACELSHASDKAAYSLSEGEADSSRLSFQNKMLETELTQALVKAAEYKDLKSKTFLDFGCGNSSAYAPIMKHTYDSVQYVGVDTSQAQIDLCRKLRPKVDYVLGDENSPEVTEKISKADIVYMRCVVMHQKNPQEFINDIYKKMEPGALLIMQEPEGRPEFKLEQIKKYPKCEILCDFKSVLGKGFGVDYNCAGYLEPFLRSLDPREFFHSTSSFCMTTSQAKLIYLANLESVQQKALEHKVFDEAYIFRFKQAVDALPEGNDPQWRNEIFHTFVLQKK